MLVFFFGAVVMILLYVYFDTPYHLYDEELVDIGLSSHDQGSEETTTNFWGGRVHDDEVDEDEDDEDDDEAEDKQERWQSRRRREQRKQQSI